jgi:uncharacterized protein YndB with AHSA1/START domain
VSPARQKTTLRTIMTRIYTAIQIDQPIEQVFDFVTTAGHWPKWHPSSLGVSGAIDHSARVGEQVVEDFQVAGRRGRVRWTVTERDAPRRWAIDGVIEGRNNGGAITYLLTSREGGAFFEREFIYPAPNLLFALLDLLIIRRRVYAESREALRRLKHVLETS